MIEKFVVDPKKADQQTMVELAQKLNEVLDVVNHPMLRAGRPVPPAPSSLQHVEFMASMAQRIRSGPLMFVRQSEPNELTKAIEEALGTFQAAVVAYKESLSTPEPEPEAEPESK